MHKYTSACAPVKDISLVLLCLERKTMETIKLREDYIKLGQALKAAGFVESGVDAKYAIEDGLVSVNGETAYQRGKKLVDGDVVAYQGKTIKIIK